MINLSPTGYKQSIIYARRNRTLINWVVAMVIGLVGIGVVVAAGFFYISQATRLYEQQVTQKKERLASQQLDETQKRVDDISNSTRLALQVLSKQVIFSGLLQQIGSVIPSGSTLQTINISKVEGGIDLQIAAKDYQVATQAHVNLNDKSNQIFEKADLVNITCSDATQSTANAYPCQVTIRALFNPSNPYVFTSSNKVGEQ